VGNLDGPAYLRELQGEPEAALVLKPEEEGELDDEEYEQRALKQVRTDLFSTDRSPTYRTSTDRSCTGIDRS
jgi:hypothetical protein